MNKHFAIVFVLCALSVMPVAADDKVRFDIAPAGGMTFGYTEYEMDLYYVDEGVPKRTRSLLEFPLGTAYLGLHATMHGGADDPERAWKIDALILTNLNDPSGTMYDHDWEAQNNEALTKFSYTESNSELSSLALEVSGSKKIHSGVFDIYFQLGFNYYHYDYEIIDFAGWQLVDGVPHNMERDVTGILYVVNYYFPYAAVQFQRTHPAGNWHSSLTAGFGAVRFSDEDDHVLRFKRATGTGTGVGAKAELSIRGYLGSSYSSKRPYIEATASLHYFNASGNQTQVWYGDDPASEDYDDTGDSISGIPHDVRSLAYKIGLKIGFPL